MKSQLLWVWRVLVSWRLRQDISRDPRQDAGADPYFLGALANVFILRLLASVCGRDCSIGREDM